MPSKRNTTRQLPLLLLYREADLVAHFLTKCNKHVARDTLEVLAGLASRPGHPYSAKRLYTCLERYGMADRDLLWSEYLRHAVPGNSVVYRLLEWVERSPEGGMDRDTAANTMLHLSLFLTTTNRYLRDRTTRALFRLGLDHPDILFARTLESLGFNDPYLSERLLAACYGVAMSLWADPAGGRLRCELPRFARRIVEAMFVPEAPYATRHVLMRDYALGVTELARKVKAGCIASRKVKYLKPPFAQIPSPFPPSDENGAEDWSDVEPALHMDFKNYTIGRLVPERGNYQYDHPEYQRVLRQILRRMQGLGYSHERFGSIDSTVAQTHGGYGPEEPGKTDRYGKKYSWIAFFEMYGVRQDERRLAEWRLEERISDCDIDPSFPEQVPEWNPELPDLFSEPYTNPVTWLAEGTTPRYEHLFRIASIDEIPGPWVLLDGFIEESADDPRRVFTFLRGLLVREQDIRSLRERLEEVEYPGRVDIPDGDGDVYTFAGEVPWSRRFGTHLRYSHGKAKRNIQRAFERSGDAGIRVEVPVHKFEWESHHSKLNRVDRISFPAPAICEALNFVNRSRTLDLFDRHRNAATLYREFGGGPGISPSHVLYLREDLLLKYLNAVNRRLVWIPWGERTLHHDEFTRSEGTIADALRRERPDIHSTFLVYGVPRSSIPTSTDRAKQQDSKTGETSCTVEAGPYTLPGRSASKIGSSTKTAAICATRSRIVGALRNREFTERGEEGISVCEYGRNDKTPKGKAVALLR